MKAPSQSSKKQWGTDEGKKKESKERFINAQIDYDSTPEGQTKLQQRLEENGGDDASILIRMDAGKKRRVEAEEAYANKYQRRVMSTGEIVVYQDDNQNYHRINGPAIQTHTGRQEWYKHGKRHREDGPALISPDGRKEWYKNDKYHREDGPAVEHIGGSKEWYQNGQLHREGGPAIEDSDGTKEWYKNGKLHREDGPAKDYPDGSKFWFHNGKRHREDGPAEIYRDGTMKWYENGKVQEAPNS